jgi:hypothetical protein
MPDELSLTKSLADKFESSLPGVAADLSARLSSSVKRHRRTT